MTIKVGFCGDSNNGYYTDVTLGAGYTKLAYGVSGARFAATEVSPNGVAQVAAAIVAGCTIIVVAFGTNDIAWGDCWDAITWDETTLDIVTPCHAAIDQALGLATVLILQPPPRAGQTGLGPNWNAVTGRAREQLSMAFAMAGPDVLVVEHPPLVHPDDFIVGQPIHMSASGQAKRAAVVEDAILAI